MPTLDPHEEPPGDVVAGPGPTATARAAAIDLADFIDRSPSPYHVVANTAAVLTDHGFIHLDERLEWPTAPGGYLVRRGGSLVAWIHRRGDQPVQPFRLLGAHTDSPNLRLKPIPDTGASGYRQLAVEVYGGVLLNSWLGRDLGISGRVAVRDGRGVAEGLVAVDRPIAHLPQLAIHLDREVNESGLVLNRAQHLMPVWGFGAPRAGGLAELLAAECGVDPHDVLSWDLMLHDLAPSRLVGPSEEMLSAARIDNQLSCLAAVRSLAAAADTAEPLAATPVVALFDHEEVGSTAAAGAASSFLASTLERIVAARTPDGGPGGRASFLQALAGSMLVSADNAHATHPNYVDRHDPGHRIALDGGPVLKVNANQRYATEATTAAAIELAAERADLELQRFVNRSDLPCGSTIGPITAARLGVPAVDVGAPQLAMHSCRELCGTAGPADLTALLTAVLTG